MDITGAIREVAALASKVVQWATGGRTREENVLRDEAQHWREEYLKALRGCDPEHASWALDNLRRVRDEARSRQQPGP